MGLKGTWNIIWLCFEICYCLQGLCCLLRIDSRCGVNSFGHATALDALITVGRLSIGHPFLLLANVMIAADTSYVA